MNSNDNIVSDKENDMMMDENNVLCKIKVFHNNKWSWRKVTWDNAGAYLMLGDKKEYVLVNNE